MLQKALPARADRTRMHPRPVLGYGVEGAPIARIGALVTLTEHPSGRVPPLVVSLLPPPRCFDSRARARPSSVNHTCPLDVTCR